MRIAFLTNFIPPYRVTFYEKLCRSTRHQVVVVHGHAERDSGRPHHQGDLNAPRVGVRNVERPLGPVTLRWQAGALAAVRRLNPDAVVLLGMVGSISTWLVLLWARATGRKVLIWACGWEPQVRGSLPWRLKQHVTGLFFGLAHVGLVYSSKGKAMLVSAGVPEGLLRICFNGIEIDEALAKEPAVLAQAAALRASHAPGAGPVFLYVGGLLPDKRVDLLLDAFRQVLNEVPDARLWLVGDGPSREALHRQSAASFSAKVTWFGRIIDGVDAYFAAADVFVLPGIGGLAFNQAMFWRTPCIGSEADGTEDDLVLDGVTGFRFAPGDQASLVAAMNRAATFPERASMAEAARALIVGRNNVTEMVETFQHEFDKLSHGRE